MTDFVMLFGFCTTPETYFYRAVGLPPPFASYDGWKLRGVFHAKNCEILLLVRVDDERHGRGRDVLYRRGRLEGASLRHRPRNASLHGDECRRTWCRRDHDPARGCEENGNAAGLGRLHQYARRRRLDRGAEEGGRQDLPRAVRHSRRWTLRRGRRPAGRDVHVPAA